MKIFHLSLIIISTLPNPVPNPAISPAEVHSKVANAGSAIGN